MLSKYHILTKLFRIQLFSKEENTEGKIFSRKCIRRNAKLTIDHRFDNDIIWIPDDANVHGVDWKDNSGQIRKITVAEYFQINHGVTVRYPKMPLSK